MTTLDEKKPCFAPAYLAGIYPALKEKAYECGYALAIHGSCVRDLDVIAVPWVDSAKTPVELVTNLCEVFHVSPNHPLKEPAIKPHGRLAWSIPLWWGAYIDLSVMPLVVKSDS
jgi:hypothetical protein